MQAVGVRWFGQHGCFGPLLSPCCGHGRPPAGSSLSHCLSLPSAAPASTPQVGDATVAFRPEWDRHRLTPRHTAYLRVAEGCSHACTFCAIPGFRCAGRRGGGWR